MCVVVVVGFFFLSLPIFIFPPPLGLNPWSGGRSPRTVATSSAHSCLPPSSLSSFQGAFGQSRERRAKRERTRTSKRPSSRTSNFCLSRAWCVHWAGLPGNLERERPSVLWKKRKRFTRASPRTRKPGQPSGARALSRGGGQSRGRGEGRKGKAAEVKLEVGAVGCADVCVRESERGSVSEASAGEDRRLVPPPPPLLNREHRRKERARVSGIRGQAVVVGSFSEGDCGPKGRRSPAARSESSGNAAALAGEEPKTEVGRNN